MRNSRRHDGSGTAEQVPGLHGERSRFAAALALSLIAHVVVLGALRLPSRNAPQESPVAVILTATFRPVSSASRAPVPSAQTVPALPPPAPEPVARSPASGAPVPAEPERAAAAPRPTEPVAPAAAVPARDVAPIRSDDQVFLTSDQWTTAPTPQSLPDETKLAGVRIVGRRLLVTVWLDDTGVVRRARVVPYELDPQIATLLEQMVMQVRFSPAAVADKPIGAQADSHLCFGDDGRLDTTSKGCWGFDPAR